MKVLANIVARHELEAALRTALPWLMVSVALSWVAATAALAVFDISNVAQHYALSTIMPLVVGTATVMPLALVTNRLRAAQWKLEQLLRTDVLTGLPNRRAFFERAEVSFDTNSDAVVIMMIDIDHFKTVNDIHGHDAGDALLSSIAQTISLVISNAETRGERLTARIGGEEFGVIITELDPAAAGTLAQDIVAAVRDSSCRYRGKDLRASISLGFAQRSPNESVDDLLRKADHAAYRAKRLGRDQSQSHSPAVEMPAGVAAMRASSGA